MTRTDNAYWKKSAAGERWFIFCRCDSCLFPNIAILSKPFPNITRADAFFDSDANDSEIAWLPDKSRWKEYEDVPTDIASAASEAYACFSINANRAAVLLARTTVEAIAKDKGISNGNLYTKIETMAQKNIITDQLKDEAHEIRFLGNDMAHGDLGTPVVESDASDILGFLDTLLDYVYQQPLAIQKRRKLRAERKQPSTDPA